MSDARPTWRSRYAQAEAVLGSSTEARWLVEEAAGSAWPVVLDEAATGRAGAWFDSCLARRVAGEPLQYVLGHWSFRSLDVLVDRRVLIPRPETEITVEVALGELDRMRADSGPVSTVVDLGTGSGVIALSLARERSDVSVWATDASADALHVARANVAGMGGSAATRIRVVEGRWWAALPDGVAGTVDLVVSNPPYVSSAEMTRLDPMVADWEPATALCAGTTGLEDVAEIVGDAPRWLRPGGAVVVEIAPHQAERVVDLARRSGLIGAQVHPDLAGRLRVLAARAPEAARAR